MKTSVDIKAARWEMAKAAQKVYDDWDESDEDTYAGGGICHFIAEELVGVLDHHGIECQTVSSTSEVHVYAVAKVSDGVFVVDIPYDIYETGGGYSWKKRPDIRFAANDVTVSRVDSDPEEFFKYVDEDMTVLRFGTFLAEKMNEKTAAGTVKEFWDSKPVTKFQKDITAILDALKAGKLHPTQKEYDLKSLIPTQLVVNMKKVANKLDEPDDPEHPMVVMKDDNKNYLIDGHHRAVANMLRGKYRATCTRITAEDAASALAK